MTSTKRRLALAALSLCLSGTMLAPVSALAQAYPTKPINFIVASSAGGILDTVGRIVARGLEKMGQPVVVQNISGAGSTLGTAAVVRAPADGYTVGMVATSHAINPSVYSRLPYDTTHDLVFVSHAVNLVNVLAVSTNVPARNLKEFIALAKQKPGTLNCGSAGNGQSNHLSLEMFNAAAGIKLNHVPYKGSANSLNDLVGGFISCMFVDALSAAQYAKADKLRILAVTSSARLPSLPSVPTFAESGLGDFNGNSWLGVVMRAGTPKEIMDKVSAAASQVLNEPEMHEKLIAMGVEPVGASVDKSVRFLDGEIARYGAAVKAAGVKLD